MNLATGGFNDEVENPRIRHGPDAEKPPGNAEKPPAENPTTKRPNRARRIAIIGPVEQLILLSILYFGNKAYGAQIRQDIEERADVRMSIGALYSTLKRMQDKGLVNDADGTDQGNKRYFSVTGKGRTILDESLNRVDMMRTKFV